MRLRTSATRLVVVTMIVGLLTGVLGVIGWRYTALRLLVDTNPPYVPPGKRGYMFVVNYLEHVYGPAWWPVIVVLPAAGLGLGACVGLLAWVGGRRLAGVREHILLIASACTVVGALTGLCTAAVAQAMPPTIGVFNNTGRAPHVDSNNLSGFPDIVGAPPFWDLRPGYLFFTIAGGATALTMAGVCIVATGLLGRLRRSNSVRSHRDGR